MDLINKLQNLRPYCLVATARSGSDFLQSLLDGHPQVCTFNMSFRFLTEYLPSSITWKNEKTHLEDLIDEFIGKNLYSIVTIYNPIEGQVR